MMDLSSDLSGVLLAAVIIIGVVFFSMVLHELMHGLTAYWLGDNTAKHQGRLTLNPLSHIDPFMTIILPLMLFASGMPIFGGAKPVPFNPEKVRGGVWGVALVAAVGPLTNLLLAFVCCVLLAIFHLDTASGVVGLILYLGMSVNLGFFAFNILPIPPLDGSRILYAIAPDYARKFLEMIEPYGVWILFGLIFIPAILNVDSIVGGLIQVISRYVLDGFNLVLSPLLAR